MVNQCGASGTQARVNYAAAIDRRRLLAAEKGDGRRATSACVSQGSIMLAIRRIGLHQPS
jgi:hypothetical protein